jgi:hypothetical protein
MMQGTGLMVSFSEFAERQKKFMVYGLRFSFAERQKQFMVYGLGPCSQCLQTRSGLRV